jgi:hypothetical protein
MKLLFERVVGYEDIAQRHISTFPMFLQSSRKHFETLETAQLPAHLPRFTALYHAALLQAI